MSQLYEAKITVPELVEGLVILASESTKRLLSLSKHEFCASQAEMTNPSTSSGTVISAF